MQDQRNLFLYFPPVQNLLGPFKYMSIATMVDNEQSTYHEAGFTAVVCVIE